MKKTTIIMCLTFLNFSIRAQSDYPDVKTIFSKKEDVDFVLLKTTWYEENFKYYIHGDTLYYSPFLFSNYKIPLQDVEFSTTKVISDTVYKKKNNEPAVRLVLFAKNDKFFFFKENLSFDFSNYDFKKDKARNKTATLVFPDQEYAESVKEYLIKLVEPGNGKNSSSSNQFYIFDSDLFSGINKKAPSFEEPSYEELCSVTTGMINDLQNNQLRNYMGTLSSSQTFYGMELRKYNSKTNFPNAIKTLINDTTALQKFRSVAILLVEETSTGQEISVAMYDYYANIGGLLYSCLEPNKFTCNLSDPDPFNRSLKRASYTLQSNSSQNSTVNLLTAGSTIVVELTISQTDNKNGSFTTQMNVKIMKV